MKIKIEFYELNWFQCERAPGLPAEQIAQDGLQI